MTRNTKIHKLKAKEREYLFRDLTAAELSFLEGIKNEAQRFEIAGRLALYEEDVALVDWPILISIGEQSISLSTSFYTNDVVFEMTVKDMRAKIEDDFILTAITFILRVLPGQSITELMNLTPKDLIELLCVCEKLINKPLLEFGETKKKPKMSLVNPESLTPDQTKNLRQEIAKLNSQYGIPK
jgi:hypothetical protein